MLRLAALLRTDVSEVSSAFIIRVTRIGELGTTLTVASNRRKLPAEQRDQKKKLRDRSSDEKKEPYNIIELKNESVRQYRICLLF
jgi:hypothetical protein